MSGMGGLGHDFKAGVNFINEPKLYITFNSGSTRLLLHAPRQQPRRARSAASPGARAARRANLPMKQFGVYFQDDWRVNEPPHAQRRPPLRPGHRLRHRPVEGHELRQAAGRRPGRASSTASSASRSGGRRRRKTTTTSSRASASRGTCAATARTWSAAGWGIYYDFGYTNANILFPRPERAGRVGRGLHGDATPPGIKNPDGSFFTVGQPISNIASPEPGEPGRAVLQLERGRAARQAAVHAASSRSAGRTSSRRRRSSTSTTSHVEGNDLGVRWPLNTDHAGRHAPLRVARLQPGEPDDEHEHRREQVRRLQHRHPAPDGQATVQLNAWYQLVAAPAASAACGLDELTTNLVQDATNPLADVQWGPVGPHRRAPQGHDQRRHQAAVGHLRVADLPVPLGAAAPHLDRLRRERRRREQRHLHDRLQVHGHRRRGQPVVQGDRRVRDTSTAAAARRCRSSTCACRRSFKLGGTA